MPRAKTTDEHKRKIKQEREARYLARHPEVKARKLAKANERARQKRAEKRTSDRVCRKCGVKKPLDAFPLWGVGHSWECVQCGEVKTEQVKKDTGYDRLATRYKKPSTFVLESQNVRLASHGWRFICADGDYHGNIYVYMKGLIIMYTRRQEGKKRYSVAFDDSGDSFLKLADAEKRERKIAGGVA